MFKSLLKAIGKLFHPIIGSPRWEPAPWMHKTSNGLKRNPKRSVLILLFLLLLSFAAKSTYTWYVERPQPISFDAVFSEITVPNLKSTTPSQLTIKFNINTESLQKAKDRADKYSEYEVDIPKNALRLDRSKQTHENQILAKEISLTPFIEGKWTSSENTLYFTPVKNWPASVDYEVSFADSLFIENVSLSEQDFTFKTADFKGVTSGEKLHADPNRPSELRFVSTFTFTHPIDADSLKQKYKFFVQDEAGSGEYVPLEYTLTADSELNDHAKRLYYINSAPVKITNATRYLRMQLDDGLKFAETPAYQSRPVGSGDIQGSFKEDFKIPSSADFFKLENSQVQIVRDEDNNPQQAMIIELSDTTTLESVSDYLEVYLLPIKYPARPWDKWSSPSEISPNIEELSERLNIEILPIENDASRVFSFIFQAPENRQVFTRFKKGANSSGGYTSAKDYRALHATPNFPKEVDIMGVGSVLNRSGNHELGFVARGVEQLRVTVSQVRTDHINHLISQTGGNFQNPNFSYPVSPENISVVHREVLPLAIEANGKATYASIDLTGRLQTGKLRSGLFHVQVNGENLDDRSFTQTQRIILITDIGFISKVNADQTQDVFVQSIETGSPMLKAKVSVLGKNGLSVFEAMTDFRGHVTLPNLKDFKKERQPIAILVERDNDLAYLPINNYQRQLKTSRFSTGGVYWNSNNEQNLRGLVFTDRGIYRPGEKVQLGMIVRNFDLSASQQFPVELTITDSRNVVVYKRKHKLPSDGFFEAELETFNYSATGIYSANLTLVENREEDINYQHLGNVNFSVEEFQPDKLKIKSKLSSEVLATRNDAKISDGSIQGWLKPSEVSFEIDLQNLFGTPAQDRKVSAKYRLQQSEFSFKAFKGYRFSDPYDYSLNTSYNYQMELDNSRTDDTGTASFNIDLDDFAGGNYRLFFDTSGYEQNGGRSVQARNTILFSPRDFLIGYKISGDLNYLKRNEEQSVAFQCINRFVEATECNNLSLEIVEKKYVSTLVKQPNGTYQYQSIEKKKTISSTPLSISKTAYTHKVDTQNTGEFELHIVNKDGESRQHINYQVIGASNLSADLEQDAQLDIVLDKKEYAAGEWIELQLKAPYSGSGLISIETTKTHHFEWFKTDSSQSIQRIRVPEGLQANAYVQVAFVRAPNSKEIFTAPLSYAIAPFNISRKKYSIDLKLDVAEKIIPGQELKIKYSSDQTGRIAIFAVDEGILQVAKHQTPKPLNHFLEKRALQVSTYQMFDLLLPEFDLMQELSAAGGGSYDEMARSAPQQKNLNPFARVVKDPVAFWSGIIKTDPEERTVSYKVPDHFDGTLRVMAVAVSETSFAHTQNSVIARGPFIVTPTAPTVVAPGDSFDVAVGVSNQLEGSGKNAQVIIEAIISEHIEVLEGVTQTVNIAEGNEQTINFSLKTKRKLGSAELKFTARLVGAGDSDLQSQRSATATMSVRPATLKNSSILSGRSFDKEALIPLKRDLLDDLSETRVYASTDPALLVNGLISYLNVFPHACTEQIVSQAMPLMAFVDHPNYLGTPEVKQEKLLSLFKSIRQRQLSNGGFTLWPGGNNAADIPTVHSVHMMLDAQEKGVNVPSYVLDNSLEYLETIAYELDSMRSQPELAAYALYLLTRSGEITNNSLIQLETILKESYQDPKNKGFENAWKQELTAAYMAASYKLLKRTSDANSLIKKYKFKNARGRINRYDSSLYRDAMVMYLMAEHFPEEFKQDDKIRLQALVDPILSGNMNTLSSGRALLALRAYSDLSKIQNQNADINLASSQKTVEQKPTATDWTDFSLQSDQSEGAYPFADLGIDIRSLRLKSNENAYYQTTQVGFDKLPPTKSLSQGLEISKTYKDKDGKTITGAVMQGDDVFVTIRVRSTDSQRHDDIAVIDLLPGGFEIERETIRNAQSWTPEYIDIREDRLVYYGSVGINAVEIRYKARLTTSGEFIVPAVYANAMYDESLKGHSESSQITVTKNQ